MSPIRLSSLSYLLHSVGSSHVLNAAGQGIALVKGVVGMQCVGSGRLRRFLLDGVLGRREEGGQPTGMAVIGWKTPSFSLLVVTWMFPKQLNCRGRWSYQGRETTQTKRKDGVPRVQWEWHGAAIILCSWGYEEPQNGRTIVSLAVICNTQAHWAHWSEMNKPLKGMGRYGD